MTTVSKLSNDVMLQRKICVQKIARFHQEDHLILEFHSRANQELIRFDNNMLLFLPDTRRPAGKTVAPASAAGSASQMARNG